MKMKWEKELPYLWGEYQYRHDLVWRVALRLSLVVASLSVLPYAKASLTEQMGRLMLLPPGLAVVLAILGSAVIFNEYRLLSTIRMTYRRLQNDFFTETLRDRTDGEIPQHPLIRRSLFAVFLAIFLLSLLVLSLANFIFLARVWI